MSGIIKAIATKITPAAEKYLLQYLGRECLSNLMICAEKITLKTAKQLVDWYKKEFESTSSPDRKLADTPKDELTDKFRPLMTKAARKYLIEQLGYDVDFCFLPPKTLTLPEARKFVKWYKEEYLPSLADMTDLDLPADLPEDLRALAKVDPFVRRNIVDPYIKPEVYDFLEKELKKMGLTLDALWFGPNLTLDGAAAMINYLRKKRGWKPIKPPKDA